MKIIKSIICFFIGHKYFNRLLVEYHEHGTCRRCGYIYPNYNSAIDES